MAPNKQDSGRFVTIDGPNGSGKTTLVERLAGILSSEGHNIVQTLEPTRTSLGNFVRESEASVSGIAYACLIAADRYSHLETVVLPAIQQGKLVLSARYVESSLVLQRLDGLTIESIWRLNQEVLRPDLSVLLQVTPDTLRTRLARRNRLSRFERESSREIEHEYYSDAATFLTKQGFNVFVHNNHTLPLDASADALAQVVRSQLFSL